MSLRSLITRHGRQLLGNSIQVEVRSSGTYDRSTGQVSGQVTTIFDAVASDAGALRKEWRGDSTAIQATAFFYVPVPLQGLPFQPELAETVIDHGKRYRVVRVRPRRVRGTLVGYQIDVAGGAG